MARAAAGRPAWCGWPVSDDDARRTEVAQRLAAVRARIDRASAMAGRSAADVRLVVVTKTFPASDVALLAALGVTDVGENRHPEARDKAAAGATLGLTWHFVGQLQANKAAAVAAYSDVVHSVDRLRLVSRLAAGADSAGRRLGCLVQVSLDQPTAAGGRGGATPEDAMRVADALAQQSALTLLGVMAVAPLGAAAEPAFARLADIAARVRAEHQQAVWISAGMSADFETAIGHGATHVRVGSAVLGKRPPLR